MPGLLELRLVVPEPDDPECVRDPVLLAVVPASRRPSHRCVLIHGLEALVKSLTLPALTCSAICPPPHCWKRSGGSSDCSATGIFVRNCSFCSGTTSIRDVRGASPVLLRRPCCQNPLPGSVLALCHHVMLTASAQRLDPVAATALADATTATSAEQRPQPPTPHGRSSLCRCATGHVQPFSVAAAECVIAARVLHPSINVCQPLSITFLTPVRVLAR